MTSIQSSQTQRRRRTRANTGGITAREIAQRIRDEAPAGWWRHECVYGSLHGSWLPPTLRPIRRKLLLVVEVLLARVLESLDPDWTATLEHDAFGEPTAILLSMPGDTIEFPVSVTNRAIRIGTGAAVIGLAGRDAGRRILERLADLCAAELGAPAGPSSIYH